MTHDRERSTETEGIGGMASADGRGEAELLDDGSANTGPSSNPGTVRTEGNLARNIVGLVIVLAVIGLVVALLVLRG